MTGLVLCDRLKAVLPLCRVPGRAARVSRETCVTGYVASRETCNTASMLTVERPECSEITSPLAEYLSALVASTRGHLVSMLNADSHDDRERAFVRGMRDLERLNALIAPDLLVADTFDAE